MSVEKSGEATEQVKKQEEGRGPEGAPVFRVQKIYVKDLSFENPDAPHVFLEQGAEPKADVQLKLENRKLDGDNYYEVTMAITTKVSNSKNGRVMFIVELEHSGVFLLQNIPEIHIPAVLAVECPSLLFPFTRQIISQATVDGGFMPFMMDPVNFLALYENTRKQAEQETAAAKQ